MGIDQSPYWANLFLYFPESKYIKDLILKCHGVSRFIGDFCVINDDNEFQLSFKNIYPRVRVQRKPCLIFRV